jgi:hypothetical protein
LMGPACANAFVGSALAAASAAPAFNTLRLERLMISSSSCFIVA